MSQNLLQEYTNFMIELGDAFEEIAWLDHFCRHHPILNLESELEHADRYITLLHSKARIIQGLCNITLSCHAANTEIPRDLCYSINRHLAEIRRDLEYYKIRFVSLWLDAISVRLSLQEQLAEQDQQ